MPQKISRTIREIAGLKRSDRRDIVFLEGDDCNAKDEFDSLDTTKSRLVRDRLGYWIDGNDDKPTYCHGWDNAPYELNYCFKWKDNQVHQRLYGFLCNPDRDNPRLRVCVLVTYDSKTKKDTDLTILDAINRIRAEKKVEDAIKTWLDGRKGILNKK